MIISRGWQKRKIKITLDKMEKSDIIVVVVEM